MQAKARDGRQIWSETLQDNISPPPHQPRRLRCWRSRGSGWGCWCPWCGGVSLDGLECLEWWHVCHCLSLWCRVMVVVMLTVPLSSIHWSSPMASSVTQRQPHLAFYNTGTVARVIRPTYHSIRHHNNRLQEPVYAREIFLCKPAPSWGLYRWLESAR